jgi:hypothetical protein
MTLLSQSLVQIGREASETWVSGRNSVGMGRQLGAHLVPNIFQARSRRGLYEPVSKPHAAYAVGIPISSDEWPVNDL